MVADAGSWLGTFHARVPAGDSGRDFLQSIPTSVPDRGEPGRNAARERYCLVAALLWWLKTQPEFFPVVVARVRANQAPDFLVRSETTGAVVGLEHTDAGLRVFQRWMDRLSEDRVSFLPSPGGRGWRADMPERSFRKQLSIAMCRKRDSWRDAPAGSYRVILAYDNTSTRLMVRDADVPALLRGACEQAGWCRGPDEGVLLVRTPELAFFEGELPETGRQAR